MANETIVIDIVANFKNQTAGGMASAKQSTDRFTESVQKAKREADRLGGTHAQPRVSVIDRASSTLSQINSGLRSIGGKTVRAGVKILDYATAPLRAIKNTLFSVKSLVLAIGAGWAANKLFSNPISLADSYSSAKIGFSTLFGNAEGQKMMDNIDAFAKATPFKTSGVINNVQKMMAMGWDPQRILKDMETIGDAAAATGKGDEGLGSIVYALSEIRSKGKLSTQELNQLASAGIKAKAYLAEGLGYGTSDTGLKKLAEDLEKGAIGANQAIDLILKGMEEFDGMMDRTANETVEGLKSQIEDTFEINILRRWGQGLQEGTKRGLGSIVKLLDESEGSLEKFGDTVYEIGKELSNWAADKLEGTIDKIIKLTKTKEFQDASLFGKVKLIWDDIIAKPFSAWWDSKGKKFISEKLNSIGEGIGSGLSNGLLALFGIDINHDAIGEATSLGASFGNGFAKGFEGKKVWDAIINAAGRAFKAGFKSIFQGSALSKIITTGIALKVTTGIFNGLSAIHTVWAGTGAVSGAGTQTLAGMGLKGILGSASTASGSLVGSGLIGGLASLGMKSTAHAGAGLLGKVATVGTPYTGLGLSLAGLGTAGGIIGGVAGLGNSISDLTSAVESQTDNDKKLYGTRAATKAGMVGIGAGIGTLIAPGIGTAIGAGLGGLATYLAGNKVADSISGVSKTTAELNEEIEKASIESLKEHFGDAEITADALNKRIQELFGQKTLNRVNKFNTTVSNLDMAKSSLLDYSEDLAYVHARIMDGEKLSASDVEEYKNSLTAYADATNEFLTASKKSARSAFKLLFGDDTEGYQQATKTMNSTYTKLEKKLAKKTTKLNDVIAKAFDDGKITIDEQKKIDEILGQIEKIQNKIDERLQKEQQAQAKAAMDLIGMKYKDTDLTVESFKTLLSELDAQGAINQQAYDDAYVKAKAEIDLELELKEITQDEYNEKLKEIEQKWREGKAITVKQSVNVAWDVLSTNYSDEIGKLDTFINNNKGENSLGYGVSKVRNASKTTLNGLTTYSWHDDDTDMLKEMKDNFLTSAGIDSTTQEDMKTLYEQLKPQEEDLKELKQSYKEAGEKVPQWIQDGLNNIDKIKLMSGDNNSFYKILGEQIAQDDPETAKKLIEAKGTKVGKDIPKALIKGMKAGMKESSTENVVKYDADVEVTAQASSTNTGPLLTSTNTAINNVFTNPFSATARLLSTIQPETPFGTLANNSYTSLKEKVQTKFSDNPFSATAKLTASVSPTTSFSTLASNSFSSLKTSLTNKFSTGISISVPFAPSLNKVSNTGSGVGPVKKANGAYVDKPIISLVGEAGPEMIIPLSANRRQRGKALWERAGRAMGLYQNANGGLYGLGSSRLGEMLSGVNSVGLTQETQKVSAKGAVHVEVGGVNITIQSSGNGIQEDIKQNADAISGQIAAILEQAFQNMPVTVE